MKKVLLSFAVASMIAALTPLKMTAQGVEFSVGADIVSSYVWRGSQLSGASAQPSAELSIGDFSLGVWGSTDLSGYKEVDFTASYSIGGLGIAVSDYFIPSGARYFDYSETGNHVFEGTLSYTLPEKFPLSIAWSTNFAGADLKYDGKRAFSTYVELGYPVTVKDVELGFSLGFTPWEGAAAGGGYYYTAGTDGFSVVNIGVKASKTIKITDSFSIPAFSQLVINPEREDIFLVFGLSL
ncbi:MAG: hypothetical protein LBD45_02190 [Bacteroidales bacterium]|jgi:hypothetical protein|nr:hypothetical protein [Bacteroidales bacterium]